MGGRLGNGLECFLKPNIMRSMRLRTARRGSTSRRTTRANIVVSSCPTTARLTTLLSRTRHRNIRTAIAIDPLIEDFITIAAERDSVLSEIKGLGEVEVEVEVEGDLAERIELAQSRFTEAHSCLAIKYSGPHDPCVCGSGKKFKHCHGARNRAE